MFLFAKKPSPLYNYLLVSAMATGDRVPFRDVERELCRKESSGS